MREPTGHAGRLLLVVATSCAGAVGATVGGASAAGRGGTVPEPVVADVIAQGTVYFPEGTFHWRSFETELGAGDEPSLAPEPFAIVVVTDGIVAVGEGPPIPLPAGGSMMVEQDPRPLLSSTDGATYRTLQIYDEANSEPDFATGESFSVDGAPHQAELLQAVLDEDQETTIAESGLPVLVLAIDGGVEVATGDEEPIELEAGESDTFDGDLTITASTESATIVAAVLTPPGGAPGADASPTGRTDPSESGEPETIALSMGIDAPSEAAPGSTIRVTVTIDPPRVPGVRSQLIVSGSPTDFVADREPDCSFEQQRDVAVAADEPTIETFDVPMGDPPDGGRCTIRAVSASQFVTGSATDFVVTIAGG